MILVSKPRIRPVFNYIGGKWERSDLRVESDGHSITVLNQRFEEKWLTDLTAELGVVSYGLRTDDRLTVFDFSSMHLCPCQLDRVRTLI